MSTEGLRRALGWEPVENRPWVSRPHLGFQGVVGGIVRPFYAPLELVVIGPNARSKTTAILSYSWPIVAALTLGVQLQVRRAIVVLRRLVVDVKRSWEKNVWTPILALLSHQTPQRTVGKTAGRRPKQREGPSFKPPIGVSNE